VRRERLIVLDDHGVWTGWRRTPQIRSDRLDPRGRRCGGRRILRRGRSKDEARAKDESRRKGKPAHVSDCHVAVSSMHG
jgi:hypothetical protein